MKPIPPRIAVEDCPWRSDVRHAGEPDEVANCRLLGAITCIRDESLFVARRKNCESCVRKFEPGPDRINALIATLLYQLSERIIARGGIENYDLAHARELQKFAVSHLPVFGTTGWAQPVRGAECDAPCFYLGEQIESESEHELLACTHEAHADTTPAACRACLDYEPALTQGTVRTWAVGVTTAPRDEPTLAASLHSLANAGWPEAHVFAEPDSPLPAELADERVTMRRQALGAWPNWLLALQELTMRSPHAEAYLLCQDDVLYCRGLRAYLEEHLWPATRLGVVSLHTASHQDQPHEDAFFPVSHGWSAWGAQAYVFPNAAARALLRHPRVINHRPFGPREGTCNIDSVVGQWALDSGLPYYLHSPSLTQHIGETSTLWEKASAAGRRRAATFVGEETDIRGHMDRAEGGGDGTSTC